MRRAWQQTPAGKAVSFTTSYGPSGDQARAVGAGLKADLVFLSTGDDVNTLVDAGLVGWGWQKQSYNGNEAYSVVFAFRGGNPEAQNLFNTSSRRTARAQRPNTFLAGKGDVLLTYQSEAIAAQQAGQTIGYLVPARTMLIELAGAQVGGVDLLDGAGGALSAQLTREEEAELEPGQIVFVSARAAAPALAAAVSPGSDPVAVASRR